MDDASDKPSGAGDPFDPPGFREAGHRLVDLLADYLERTGREAPDLPVLRWTEPGEMADRWPPDFPEEPEGTFEELWRRFIDDSIHLHHPRYIGHQVAPSIPASSLAEFAASLLNNSSTIYEMSSAVTMMERSIIRWMADRIGYGASAGGVMVTGGALGNLTALLAARQARAGFDAWEEGDAGGPPLAVLGSDQLHYSVDRGVRILGWGAGGCEPVRSDGAFRLLPADLPRALERARARGRRIIGVVANAGSTATGTIDPLEEIADFCARHGLWLHVDGAHGASLLLAPACADRLAGIARADSVVWDAHKMLAVPCVASGVVFAEEKHSWEAFSSRASYLFERERHEEWYNLGHRTVECTKIPMSIRLYALLRVCGTRFFADYITRTVETAHAFWQVLEEAPDFEAAVEPEMNIVCFRYRPADGRERCGAELDALQALIRRRLIESGAFYLVQTELPGGLYLRTTITNPRTTLTDLTDLLDLIRDDAQPA